MLRFNLKKKWFDKIKSGEKIHEYREVKPYWTKRFCKELCVNADELKQYTECNDKAIVFIKGYSNKVEDKLLARLYSIKVRNGKNTDLGIDKDVYDIEFELVRYNFERD